MRRPGRWWWLDPKHKSARCKAVRQDPYYPGQCKNMARKGGYCKVHMAKKYRKVCPTCKRPMF